MVRIGLAPLTDRINITQSPRIAIPDDWGLRMNRNGVMANYGVRETKNCSGTLMDVNPVLSWITNYVDENLTKNNFYIDNYMNPNSYMEFKTNIMKFNRLGRVGIGLPTYAYQEPDCGGNPLYPGSYTRDPNLEEFPQNTLDIEGNMAIGIDFSGSSTAPYNGLLVQGQSGFGLNNPNGFMHIKQDDAYGPILKSENTATGGNFTYNVLSLNDDVTTKAFAAQFDNGSTVFENFVVLASGQSGFASGINPSYTMNVNGSGSINSAWVVSDQKFKQNIKPISNPLDLIMKIRGVRYDYIPNSKRTLAFGGKITEIKMNFDYDKPQIGYIAQELELVVPELVKTDLDGYKAVNYSQMVALLTEGIKEQQTEIEALQAEVENLKAANIPSNDNSKNNPSGSNANNKLSWLKQNTPNPFTQNSTIEMYINLNAKSVSLRVYDLTGVQLKAYSIDAIGFYNLPISANEFKPGQYLYSLIIDGKEIDTKKMVILD